ncbi:MAG: hypothetical protein M1820_002647 [Bogoriella megaspora]|nr:MAG: hypothetical protein M1820_002647 [Bogoriella megaspora]
MARQLRRQGRSRIPKKEAGMTGKTVEEESPSTGFVIVKEPKSAAQEHLEEGELQR